MNQVNIFGFRSNDGGAPLESNAPVQAIAVSPNGGIFVSLASGGQGLEVTQYPNSVDIGPSSDANNLAVVNFPFMLAKFGEDPGDAIFTQFKGMSPYNQNLLNSLQVGEAPNELMSNVPAADTEAELIVSANPGQQLLIRRIGYSVTAVAAIAAPITVELLLGAVVIWSTKVIAPAGTCIDKMFAVNFAAGSEDAITMRCDAPGATNFCTVSLEVNPTYGAPLA